MFFHFSFPVNKIIQKVDQFSPLFVCLINIDLFGLSILDILYIKQQKQTSNDFKVKYMKNLKKIFLLITLSIN